MMRDSGVLRTGPDPDGDGRSGAERTAAWMVGETLSCVLHIGDGSLAYVLADQGHDVVVVGDDATTVRHPEISYVRTAGERLPFRPDVFDVVVATGLRDAPTALAEYARVLRADGLLSTVSRHYDDAIPWMRKLREIIGDRNERPSSADTFSASGLFAEPESAEFGAWEKLDLAGLLRFAEQTRHPTVGDAAMPQVRQLFESYGAQTGALRLRHTTSGLRARVLKENVSPEPDPPETYLVDLG